MAAAHALCATHAVTLIEAEPRLGGHARTIQAGRHGAQPVDTGFIVYNKVNYPNLVRLFEDLGVPEQESDMSFAASLDGGRVEYSLQTADTMFAQRKNLLSPRFVGMVRDIFKFNARAARDDIDPDLPLSVFLDEMGLGQAFRDWYLGPISGAIWSTPSDDVMAFPARALIRFFDNHNLLHHTGQHIWYTVKGGSIEYVRRLEAHLRQTGVELRLGAPVQGIRRTSVGAEIRLHGGTWESFDDVILATHSDDSLQMLSDPSADEARLLSQVRYQPNRAVLHADRTAMPRLRKVWASWNYREPSGPKPEHLGLTYWMNRLQSIPEEDPIFSTLNPHLPIREETIYDETVFRHPVYDTAMADAVAGIKAMNGANATWFCGAWMRDGFHEDGFASALDVVDAMALQRPLPVAAE